jgi:hypothetical protein
MQLEVQSPTDCPVDAIVPGDVVMSPAERAALACNAINQLEAYMLQLPQTEYPLTHRFVPKNGALDSGIYVRECVLPAQTVFITEIHRTEHPFVISKGLAKVWSLDTGWVTMSAPHTGITKAGTRRVISTLEETIWTTFHATNETDVDKIKGAIILPHVIVGRPTLNFESVINLLQ